MAVKKQTLQVPTTKPPTSKQQKKAHQQVEFIIRESETLAARHPTDDRRDVRGRQDYPLEAHAESWREMTATTERECRRFTADELKRIVRL